MLDVLDLGNLFQVPLADRAGGSRNTSCLPTSSRPCCSRAAGRCRPAPPRQRAVRADGGVSGLGTAFAAERAGGRTATGPLLAIADHQEDVRHWHEALRAEVVRSCSVPHRNVSAALLTVGELEGVEGRLRDAERWLDATTGTGAGSPAPPAEMVVADEENAAVPADPSCHPADPARCHAGRPRCGTPASRRPAPRTSHQPPRRPQDSWGPRSGRAGISRPRIGVAERRDYGGPGTSPISSAARSRWRTSGSRKVVSAGDAHLRAGMQRQLSRRRSAGNRRHGHRDDRVHREQRRTAPPTSTS